MDKELKAIEKQLERKIIDHKLIAAWIAVAVVLLIIVAAIIVFYPVKTPLN